MKTSKMRGLLLKQSIFKRFEAEECYLGNFAETKHLRNALKLRSVILENNCLGKTKNLKKKTATMTVLLPRFIFGSCHNESNDNEW